MRRNLNVDMLVVGGLHRDDFEWACREHEGSGYVLVRFELDFDGYHWKAVYVKADTLEKKYWWVPSDRLCVSAHVR